MAANGPIIIVEDDDDDCFILEEVFESLALKNELKFFKNGRQVLSYLSETKDKPCIIISDVNMPVMTGTELKREINADNHLRKKSIPFIFFTTDADPIAVEEAYDMMVQGFFKKENSIEQIRDMVRMIMDYWMVCRHPNSD